MLLFRPVPGGVVGIGRDPDGYDLAFYDEAVYDDGGSPSITAPVRGAATISYKES